MVDSSAQTDDDPEKQVGVGPLPWRTHPRRSSAEPERRSVLPSHQEGTRPALDMSEQVKAWMREAEDAAPLAPPRPTIFAEIAELMVGDLEDLVLGDGREVVVRVLALDNISKPCRARVQRCDNSEEYVVAVMGAGDECLPELEALASEAPMAAPLLQRSVSGWSLSSALSLPLRLLGRFAFGATPDSPAERGVKAETKAAATSGAAGGAGEPAAGGAAGSGAARGVAEEVAGLLLSAAGGAWRLLRAAGRGRAEVAASGDGPV